MLNRFLSWLGCRLLERRAAVPYRRKRLNFPLVDGIGTRRQLHLSHTAARYGFLGSLRSNSLRCIKTVRRFQITTRQHIRNQQAAPCFGFPIQLELMRFGEIAVEDERETVP